MSDDLIKRKDAIKAFTLNSKGERIPFVDCDNFPVEFPLRYIVDTLAALPPADSPQGEWITDDDGDKKCSNCGEYAPLSFDDYYMRGGKIRQEESLLLCPYCGAKMKGSKK